MKKLSSLLLGMAVTVASFAQVTPDAGDVGFSFRVSGLSNIAFTNQNSSTLSGVNFNDPVGLLGAINTVDDLVPQQVFSGKYMINSDLALRVGLGINTLKSKESSTTTDTSGASTTLTNEVSVASFGLNLGIEKHFESVAARLDPYVGLQLGIGTIGDIDFSSTATTTSGNTFTTTSSIGSISGGWAFEASLLGGFNWFISDNVAIGAEFSWGLHNVEVGGNYNVSGTAGQTNGIAESKSTTLSVGSTSGINFNIWF